MMNILGKRLRQLREEKKKKIANLHKAMLPILLGLPGLHTLRMKMEQNNRLLKL